MKYILEAVALETTRRCNMKCEHCMRGESQNIDMPKEYIDALLDNSDISRIGQICFSGGEPTLNPEIIVYTINKIISNNIDVRSIVMVTNGKVFNKEIVDAFNRFNEYVNQMEIKEIEKLDFDYNVIDKEEWIKSVTDNHARITFSIDKFHYPITDDVKSQYYQNAKGIVITEHDLEDDKILKTGNANFGKEYNYRLEPIIYANGNWIVTELYITAKGYITTPGDGTYSDMDKINIGHINNLNIEKMLSEYGKYPFADKDDEYTSDSTRK